jgi:hypothetical protein
MTATQSSSSGANNLSNSATALLVTVTKLSKVPFCSWNLATWEMNPAKQAHSYFELPQCHSYYLWVAIEPSQ